MSKEPSVGPFLDRWSRRKSESEQPESPEAPTRDSSSAEPEPAAELTDADLPLPESLGEDGDYAAFLAPGISDALRRRALRRLFTQSRFNGMDGLDDYADDFSGFPPLGDLVTREMRRLLDLERSGMEPEGEKPAADPAEPAERTDPAAIEDSDEPNPNDKLAEE